MSKKTLIVAALAIATAACATVPVPPPIPQPPQTAPGPDFLARNGAAPGVVTTASGLQYFIVRSGPVTAPRPVMGDKVSFDYEGRLTNGEIFDSSFERGVPLSGAVGRFVPGFDEALMLMRPGDEWVVWIPAALGYGAKSVGTIPPNSVLRFRLALHSVTPAAAAAP
jgi:FKBP-type peptidyl-prolyl cis-trans isomerase